MARIGSTGRVQKTNKCLLTDLIGQTSALHLKVRLENAEIIDPRDLWLVRAMQSCKLLRNPEGSVKDKLFTATLNIVMDTFDGKW